MTSEKISGPHNNKITDPDKGLQIQNIVDVCEIARLAIKDTVTREWIAIEADLSNDYLDELQEELEQFMEN